MVCAHNHFFDDRRNFLRGYLNDKGLKKNVEKKQIERQGDECRV